MTFDTRRITHPNFPSNCGANTKTPFQQQYRMSLPVLTESLSDDKSRRLVGISIQIVRMGGRVIRKTAVCSPLQIKWSSSHGREHRPLPDVPTMCKRLFIAEGLEPNWTQAYYSTNWAQKRAQYSIVLLLPVEVCPPLCKLPQRKSGPWCNRLRDNPQCSGTCGPKRRRGHVTYSCGQSHHPLYSTYCSPFLFCSKF